MIKSKEIFINFFWLNTFWFLKGNKKYNLVLKHVSVFYCKCFHPILPIFILFLQIFVNFIDHKFFFIMIKCMQIDADIK